MKHIPIPLNTVVHTPTEAEAKELLAILHENGYAWYAAQAKGDGWNDFKNKTCYRINSHDNVYHTCDREWYDTTCKYCRLPILTLAEFKERYVDFDDTFTDDCKSPVKVEKELNLCELLKGHEGETFYHLMYGEVEYKGINKDGFIAFTDSKIPTIYDDGKYDQHANVVLYPSRALYEQYPLDPYTAWMKWQEEQCRYKLDISYTTITDDIADCFTRNFGDIYFLTSADRDKCIEEIKAVIEKYSKK